MKQGLGTTRLTMKEAAEELRHSYSWMHANHRSLGLKGYRIGGRWYFDRSDLQSWEAQTKASTPWANHKPTKSNKARKVQFA
jgi:hypothetical protein